MTFKPELPKVGNIKELDDARSLVLSRCHLRQIPRIISFFKSLRFLDLSSNPITSLDPLWDCRGLQLRELNLAACSLRRLPYGMPEFAGTLKVLNLDGNFLGSSPPNFLVFTKLQKLSLVGNDFLEFPQVPKTVETLLFRLNSFAEIPEMSGAIDACYCLCSRCLNIRCRNVTFLTLKYCEIRGCLKLPTMPLLAILDVSHNYVTSMEFDSCRRLTELTASFNGIDAFPDVIWRLPMLRMLDLSHNSMTTLPKDLTRLKRLEVLDVSHNSLIMPRLVLPTRLTTIRASFNFLAAFDSFPESVQHIDASFCTVVVIPSVPRGIEWLALYFVRYIAVREMVRALTHDGILTHDSECVETEGIIRSASIETDVATLMNESLATNIGCSTTSGRSTTYEDNLMSVKSRDISFVGVFDGHVGHEAAFISSETFSEILGSVVGSAFDRPTIEVVESVRRSFAMVDDELRNRRVRDGTTAVVIGVKGRRVVVGHLGDSLALMVGSDSSEWLTKPHRPTDRDEYDKMRVQRKSVSEDWRVDGKLCVSRSLGDFWCCGGMYNEPDVTVRMIPDNIISIVLGCDGLWDYIDAGVVSRVIRNVRDPVRAAKMLQDYAFASGSHDAISVIVMNLETA